MLAFKTLNICIKFVTSTNGKQQSSKEWLLEEEHIKIIHSHKDFAMIAQQKPS